MIAEWMVYCTLLGACLAVAAWAGERLLRSYGRGGRGIWIGALLASLVVPVAVALRPTERSIPVAEPNLTIPAVGVANVVSPTASAFAVDTLLGTLWLAGSLLTFAGLGLGVARIARARRRAWRTERDGTPIAVTDAMGPGAVPFGSPRVVVPSWFVGLGEADQRLLVLHESEHVRARDPQWIVGGVIVAALQPWNPAIWWLVSRLRRAMELDCDARVLGRCPDVARYGALLLAVASRGSRPSLPAMLAFAHSSSRLRERIDAMTTPRVRLGVRAGSTLGACVALALAAACEARRPAPVAPVTDFAIERGETRPLVTAPGTPDSQRVAAQQAIRARLRNAAAKFGPLSAQPTQPVVLVENASGEVVYLGGADAMAALDANLIERVEVIKGATLPPEAAAGLILVRLTPGATFSPPRAATAPAEPGPILEAVAAAQRRARATGATRELERPPTTGGLPEGVRTRPATPIGAAAAAQPSAGDSVAVDTTAANVTRSPQGQQVAAREVHVTLEDFEGKVLFDSLATLTAGQSLQLGPHLVRSEEIARVEVRKGGAANGSTVITIRLKSGVTPSRRGAGRL